MKTIHLQGLGKVPAITAGELEPGMITIWNGGSKEEIKSIEQSKSGKSVKVVIISLPSAKEYNRTMRTNSLVAVEGLEAPKKPMATAKTEQPEKVSREQENRIDKAIRSRKITHYGTYADIGDALDKFNTLELAKYYSEKFGDTSLRYFLEQRIISAEINKSRAG